jgi:hypothetical protein
MNGNSVVISGWLIQDANFIIALYCIAKRREIGFLELNFFSIARDVPRTS